MEKECLSILIVDPNKNDHQLLRESIQKSQVPADLHFVTSTEAALSALKIKPFDLILTDHVLPQANAFHLLFALQQKESAPPVLLLTRNGEARIAREAFHRGVSDFLLKEELQYISLFDLVSNLIERHQQKEAQREHARHLRDQAERDGLTGLYNHRYFVESIQREFERAKRYRRDLSLIMIDLDGFKPINDTCGHPQGDQVLRQISRLLLQTVRFVDIVARYGGDEFAILLPETTSKDAYQMASRILDEIRKSPFLHEKKVFPLSASIGIAASLPSHDSAETLLKEADAALYQAKRGGRDQVVLSRTAHRQSNFTHTPRSSQYPQARVNAFSIHSN